MPTSCNDCSTIIGLFRKKFKCESCSRLFCGRCFSKTSQMVSKERRIPKGCLKCNIFSFSVIKREDLLLLSTKDLRYFLDSKHISMENCRERYHLVDLIMNFAEQNGQKSLTDIRKEERRRAHVENLRLAAQQREQEETIRSQSVSSNQTPSESQQEEYQQNLPGTPLHFPSPPEWKSIEDISSLDDVDSLSVIQLKKILTVNFINYRGCFEKKELTDRVKRLWKSKHVENQGTKTSSEDSQETYEENLCKICMDNAIDCVLLECGHLVTCTKCGRQLADCPICRQLVTRVVHIFKA